MSQPQNVRELQAMVLLVVRRVKLSIESNEPTKAVRQLRGLIEALEPEPTPQQRIKQVGSRLNERQVGI